MPFSDYKTALVTGASTGMGAAIVERFRREGLEVHALARNAGGDAADGTGGPRHAAKFAEQVAAVRHVGGGKEGRW